MFKTPEELFNDKEFYEKLKSICYSMFEANKEAFNRAGFYDMKRDLSEKPLVGNEIIEYTPVDREIMQEVYIKILMVFKSGKNVSYWLKTAQNFLIDMLRKFKRRIEIADFVYPADDPQIENLFYSTDSDDFDENSFS